MTNLAIMLKAQFKLNDRFQFSETVKAQFKMINLAIMLKAQFNLAIMS